MNSHLLQSIYECNYDSANPYGDYKFEFVEEINLGYINDNIIDFQGETFKVLCSDRESYVSVNGVRHDILPKTLSKFKNCSNAKEYVEAIECFAYSVLIEKSIFNDGYFAE